MRFVPNANFNGTSAFSFRGWDRRAGGNGMTADLSVTSSTGGMTPFSTGTEFATVTVNPQNDAPVLKVGSPISLSIAEDLAANDGTPVSTLLNAVPGVDLITDIDTGAVEVIAIIGATGVATAPGSIRSMPE